MKHPSITEMTHILLSHHLTEDMVAIDATVGQGFDTIFLAQHCKKVYAFDIQPQALEIAKGKVDDTCCEIEWILDSHANMTRYVHESIDVIVFNFGYFPTGDHTITTMTDSSLSAVHLALSLLKKDGWLVLCFYPGHPEGKKEMDAILEYLHTQKLLITHYETEIANSPVLYLVSHRK